MIAKAVYARLSQNAGVKALTTRLFPLVAPQGTKYPAITYGFDSDQPETNFDGAETTRYATLDVDCWSHEYLEAHELAAAVESALVDYRGDLGSLTPAITAEHIRLERKLDLHETDTKLFRVSLQFYIAYS